MGYERLTIRQISGQLNDQTVLIIGGRGDLLALVNVGVRESVRLTLIVDQVVILELYRVENCQYSDQSRRVVVHHVDVILFDIYFKCSVEVCQRDDFAEEVLKRRKEEVSEIFERLPLQIPEPIKGLPGRGALPDMHGDVLDQE